MKKEQEKWAIFWCDLLSPVIYGEIEPEATNQFLKQKAKEPVQYPDGRTRTNLNTASKTEPLQARRF